MTAPAPPPEPSDRGGPRRLTSREREILALIEDELTAADPALAHELETREPPRFGLRWPVSVSRLLLLLPVLIALAGTAALLPAALWWPVLPLLTGALVVPWVLLCARPSTDDRPNRFPER